MANIQKVAQLWADVKNYEGLYQISLNGEIKSLPKIRKIKGVTQFYPARTLKQVLTKNGYLAVSLWKEGQKKSMGVHRIIAETFIENPHNLEYVNHLNGNKVDNSIDNLEWCTASENTLHAFKSGLISPVRNRLK